MSWLGPVGSWKGPEDVLVLIRPIRKELGDINLSIGECCWPCVLVCSRMAFNSGRSESASRPSGGLWRAVCVGLVQNCTQVLG